jgi:O-antigen/teichoic acid export membrane protein
MHTLIFMVFVSPEFRAHSYLLPWFVLAGGLFSTGQMLVLKVLSEVRPRILLTVKIGTALLGLVLNVLGAWLAGIHGVVAALVTFSVVYVLGMLWLTRSGATPKA